MYKALPTAKYAPPWVLIGVMLLGLLLRLLFWQFGAAHFYGVNAIYSNGDTDSYVNSFLNLWRYGTYTFNPQEPMAAFGRLPGYPFFVGVHYLIAGPAHFQQAVAGSQVLLDTVTIGLCYQLTQQLLPGPFAGPALLTALLYATYPFAIVWVTVTGTETLGIFMVLVWAVLLTRAVRTAPAFLGLGLVIAVAFFVREYLGILLPITVAYLLLRPAFYGTATKNRGYGAIWLAAGFILLYGWRPVRNLVFQQRVVLIKPVSAGYADMRPDMLAFLDWVHLWSNDNTYWLAVLMAE